MGTHEATASGASGSLLSCADELRLDIACTTASVKVQVCEVALVLYNAHWHAVAFDLHMLQTRQLGIRLRACNTCANTASIMHRHRYRLTADVR